MLDCPCYFSLMEAGGYIYYVIHILCIFIHEVLRMGVGSPVKHGVLPGHFDPDAKPMGCLTILVAKSHNLGVSVKRMCQTLVASYGKWLYKLISIESFTSEFKTSITFFVCKCFHGTIFVAPWVQVFHCFLASLCERCFPNWSAPEPFGWVLQ